MSKFSRSELMDYFNELWTNTQNNEVLYQTNFDSQQYFDHPQQHLRASKEPNERTQYCDTIMTNDNMFVVIK